MDDDLSSISTAKNIYKTAQHNSASRHGNALFSSFSTEASSRQKRLDASSLRSSIHTVDSYVMPDTYTGSGTGKSAMGHRLLHVYAPEEEYGLDVDREEIRRLVSGDNSLGEKNESIRSYGVPSTTGSDSKSVSRSTVISDMSKADRERFRFHERWGPGWERTLVLGGLALLLATCLVFTFVNMQNKSYDDWVEPNRDAYMNEGIDWAPGDDAPHRWEGASVDPVMERNIANWALGTLRVPSEASIDGYGSVAMSQLVLERDIPLFFGECITQALPNFICVVPLLMITSTSGMEYTGAAMLDMLLGQCLGLVQASRADLKDITNPNDQLSLIWSNGRKYVNVDVTTTTGIDRAYSMGLVTSGIADVIYSPLLHDASSLFSSKKQARLFVMMRHPVEAQFARFRYLRSTSSIYMPERQDELTKMSYEEFATSEFVDDNWMTRALVHKMYGEVLTPQDMETAKEVLRRKAVIGLYDAPLISLKKYARYFNWDHLRTGGYFTDDTEKCFKNSIEVAKSKDEVLGALNLIDDDAKDGSDAWKAILKRNQFDYELYMYGQRLYKYQIGLS
jgi:hypothetical protein